MNKYKINIIILILSVIFLVSINYYINNDIRKYTREERRIMNNMVHDMSKVGKTDDVSINFLNGMIPHHEAAIDMAKLLLKYQVEDNEVRKIAENIINTQSKEIEEMNMLINEIEKNPDINHKNKAVYFKEYEDMLNGHGDHNNSINYDSVDEAFAKGMIEHHKMAIEMAKSALKYSQNDKVKNLANNIIEIQEKEIEILNKSLKYTKIHN